MLTEVLHKTITGWINDLDNYTLAELRKKPSPASWSLGQVYFHLIDNTRYYLEEARTCLNSSEHMLERPLPDGAAMLGNNEFPDAIIEGPDNNVDILQPDSNEQLKSGLLQIKDEINRLAVLISQSPYKGKTKHPGLGYFSANDWLQFADMHFRHHLKQKKRIDDFLRANR